MPKKQGETAIPPRFLRKAWFLIISHLIKKPENYTKYFDSRLTKELPNASIAAKAIVRSEPKQFIFHDDEERRWFEDGISINDEVKKINYQYAYKLLDGHIAAVCAAIRVAGDIGKGLQPYMDGEKQIKYGIKKGGAVQTSVHAGLSAYAPTDDIIEFTETDHVITFETAERVLVYAHGVVDDLCDGDKEKIAEEKLILSYLRAEMAIFIDPVSKSISSKFSFKQQVLVKHNEFWKSDQVLSGLQNTQWIVMERTDGTGETKKNQGIAVNAFMFHQIEDGLLTCEMYNQYHDTNEQPVFSHYKGMVAVGEEKKFIHIELHRSMVPSMPGFAFFNIRRGDVTDQNLFIGHYTYYSIRKKKYLTKLTVWVKFGTKHVNLSPNGEADLKGLPDFLIQYTKNLDKVADEEKFKEIPPYIRLFLDERDANRLPMPEGPITYFEGQIDSLHDFIGKQYARILNEKILRECCMRYAVCYYAGNTELKSTTKAADIIKLAQIDLLELKYDEPTLKYEAEYRHFTDPVQVFAGEVYRKDDSIQVIVNTEIDSSIKTTDKNFIFLTFLIPHHDPPTFKKAFSEQSSFSGILSGLTDGDPLPVAYYAILMKEEYISNDPLKANGLTLTKSGEEIAGNELLIRSKNVSIKISK